MPFFPFFICPTIPHNQAYSTHHTGIVTYNPVCTAIPLTFPLMQRFPYPTPRKEQGKEGGWGEEREGRGKIRRGEIIRN